MLAGPAEVVGRCFADLPPLTAYRYDLLGSLIGIGAFTLLSFLWAPSVVWGLLAAGALSAVLVPTFVELLDAGRQREAERLAAGMASSLDAAARPRWPLDEAAALANPMNNFGRKGAKA